MKLKYIFKNNIIKNVINIIKKMLENFAVTYYDLRADRLKILDYTTS